MILPLHVKPDDPDFNRLLNERFGQMSSALEELQRALSTSGARDIVATVRAAMGAQVAYASAGSLLLTTTPTDVPGCSLTLAEAGTYLITANVDLRGIGAGDAGMYLIGRLLQPDGTAHANVAFLQPDCATSTVGATVCQQWLITADPGDVVKLQAYKSAGGGTSTTGSHCSLSALYLGA